MTYTPNLHHRHTGYSHIKSQWTITVTDEENCYKNAVTREWANGENYWGLHAPQNSPQQLGYSPNKDLLYIAKFVSNQNIWHGYPVAHWLSPFDRPKYDILMKWLQNGIINKASVGRIRRGKQCAL